MSLVVYKYEVPVGPEPGISEVELPDRAWIVSFGQQNNDLFVWAVVDPEINQMKKVELLLVGTGDQFAERHCGRFLGTAHLYEGQVVVHCFQVD